MKSWKRKTRARQKALLRIADNGNNPKNKLSRWAVRRWGKDYVYSWEPWGIKLWRKQYWLRKKHDRKAVDAALSEFAKYQYIEDCRYHPCLVTKVEHDYDYKRVDFECKSVVNDTPNSCSYFHCGIVFLTEAEAFERRDCILELGMLPYQLQYIYDTPPSIEQLTKTIRYSRGLERVWKFSENGKVPEITEAGKKWIKSTYGLNWDDLEPYTDEEMENAWED